MCRRYVKFVMYVVFHVSTSCYAQETFNLCVSACTLPFSRPFLTVTDGHEFTFDRIGADQFDDAMPVTGSVQTRFDDNGNLIALNDGRTKPLVLGSMPRKGAYIQQLCQAFNVESATPIGVYSLNCPFELGWKGVPDMMAQREQVELLLHPTTDECAPSLLDVLRAVSKLRARDEGTHALSFVQCLAGHGRSATLVGAYIYTLLQGHCELPAPDVIEHYLKIKRATVSLSSLQKNFLNEFRQRLQTTSFEQLCHDHAHEMQVRDEEYAYDRMAPIIRQSGSDYGMFAFGAAVTVTAAAGIGLRKLLKAYRK